MEELPYISRESLLEKIYALRQGIMPTPMIQEWYNQCILETNDTIHCVTLCEDDTHVNPPDVEFTCLVCEDDVRSLTPGRVYEVVLFVGQPFEERYLYEGVLNNDDI